MQLRANKAQQPTAAVLCGWSVTGCHEPWLQAHTHCRWLWLSLVVESVEKV